MIADPLTAAADVALRHDHHWTPKEPTPKEQDWKLNPAKEGVDSDDCPNPVCGERDVNPYYKIGGVDGHREEYRSATIFCCPRCATSWDRTTKQGAARRSGKNLDVRHLTASADTGRVYSMPSARFVERYSLIDWSK